MDQTIRALNRFGLGARIGERTTIPDPKGWLRRQLDGRGAASIEGPALDELAGVVRNLREAQRSQDRERRMSAQRAINDVQGRDVAAMLTRRVTTDKPYVERLVAFWSNHLCVSVAAKRQVAALAGHYERAVIRPHVLGRFSDMVVASAKHPAMLFYLDNFQSIGPGSRAGTQGGRRGRARGLNENYARELLELHTVGVDGGYAQEDVEQLARILTGWTIAGAGPGTRPDEEWGFTFRPVTHEPGPKTLMGRTYRGGGVREGEEAIRDLCAHPSTAAFVAEKLVQHFVADEAPMGSVASIAGVFLETDGDLREVASALIDLEEAWNPENKKFRAPQDWIVAVFRAFRAEEAPEPMGRFLRALRHTPWAPGAPKGYGDTQREWADPDSLMNRAELGRTVARQLADGGRFDPRRLLDVVDVEDRDPLRTLMADEAISVPERVALAIGGPAFQWR